MDQIRADCREAGVPVLFVYIPTQEWGRFPTLKGYMQRVNANFLDMSEPGRLPMKGTTLRDGHLNAAGHRFVAQAISQWIGEHMS